MTPSSAKAIQVEMMSADFFVTYCDDISHCLSDIQMIPDGGPSISTDIQLMPRDALIAQSIQTRK